MYKRKLLVANHNLNYMEQNRSPTFFPFMIPMNKSTIHNFMLTFYNKFNLSNWMALKDSNFQGSRKHFWLKIMHSLKGLFHYDYCIPYMIRMALSGKQLHIDNTCIATVTLNGLVSRDNVNVFNVQFILGMFHGWINYWHIF